MLYISKIYQLGHVKEVDVHDTDPQTWEETFGAQWKKKYGSCTFQHQVVCHCPGHRALEAAPKKRAPKKEGN